MFGINDSSQDDNAVKNDGQPDAAMPKPDFDEPAGSGRERPADTPQDDGAHTSDDSLISLKEQALKSLSPLLNHLDQSPEEHFKTLMMLIQASDNSGLIHEAYEAANKISDEKERAQALLDVINEINYFTQKDDKPQS